MADQPKEEMLEGTVIIELDDLKNPTKATIKPAIVKATRGKYLNFIYKGTGKVTILFPVDWFEGNVQARTFGGATTETDVKVRGDATGEKDLEVPYQVYCEVINDYGQAASPPKMKLDP